MWHARSRPAGVVWHALATAFCFGSCRIAAAGFRAARGRSSAAKAYTRVASASASASSTSHASTSRAGPYSDNGAADSTTRDVRLDPATPATQHRLRICTAASAGCATC